MTERGAGSVLVLVAAAVTLAFGCATVLVGNVLLAAERARTAADLAALAGADALGRGRDPCQEAGTVARANGARLAACAAPGPGVRVEVTVPAPFLATVRARASAEPGVPGGYSIRPNDAQLRRLRARWGIHGARYASVCEDVRTHAELLRR